MKTLKYLIAGVILTSISCTQNDDKPMTNYPATTKSDHVDTYFGVEVADPYRWLENDTSEATGEWVKAENEVTFGYLNHIPYRDKVKTRLEELMDYERVYAPTKHGSWEYFYRNDGLQNQNVLYRKKVGSSTEEIFLDPNNFREDGTISLAGTSFTAGGSLVAYQISEGGSDWRKAIIMNTETKEILGDTLKDIKFSGLAWKGTDGFYYSSYDKPKGSELSSKTQQHKLYYHKLGTAQTKDQLIFGGDQQERRYVSAYLTEDERFLVISAAKSTSGNELYFMDLALEAPSLITVVGNFDNNSYILENEGDELFIHTDFNAPNNRLVKVNAANPTPENWVDVIAETENVLSSSTGGGKIFARYLVDAKAKIVQYLMDGTKDREVGLPGIGSAYGFGALKGDTSLYYTFTSFTTPPAIYSYDINSGKSTLYIKPKVAFNPDDYVTEQVFYESKDGTKIPMFIVYKKGIELNGKNPTYLYAYGGFNISLTPSFSTSRIIWLENGGIYAQPNLRGGGEYGEKWHIAGTKMQKQNVFDDFIAAAQYLKDKNYTSSDYLAIAGGSNGGLLVGATMTQQPDIAKVAFPAVGVMDMLRYHQFTAGAGWAYDYGTSDDSKEMFEYLKDILLFIT